MRQKNQLMRYSDAELSLMKNTFADNEDFLFAIRKFLLGLEMTDGEKDMITLIKGDLLTLLKKVFTPKIDGDAPFFQLVDMKSALNVDMKDRSEKDAIPYIEAKIIEIKFLEERFDILEGKKQLATITLEMLSDLQDPKAYINMLARNYLLSYIDSFTNEIKLLSGKKEETIDQTVNRLRKNSNK